MDLLEYLKAEISDSMSLPEIIDAFERMCEIPVEDDLILFETGTYTFPPENVPHFYFSLVRQFPSDDNEFRQLHVRALYKPDAENRALCEQVWSDDLNIECIFDVIRLSKAYEYASRHPRVGLEIYLDET